MWGVARRFWNRSSPPRPCFFKDHCHQHLNFFNDDALLGMTIMILSEFNAYLPETEPIFRIQYLFEKAKQKREERQRAQAR